MNKNDKKRKALISTLKGFRKNTPEKLYWVVDLQDWEDIRLLTLDEAKEHLEQFWDEEDYQSVEEMNEHNQAIQNADADELNELLLGIDWTLFKTQEEYKEYAHLATVK
ncbi:hypothetical protein [Cytobacillus sp. FSL K6-0265]|uniref:hypothetical protein n=1 Tax=Cytobacillus sp. FSL K6-0265 TaxID=2921448 RepID=UPI0030F581A0